MACAIMLGLSVLLCAWLRAWPSLTARFGCSSSSHCWAIVCFVWTILGLFSAAAFVLTVFVVPYDLHFANDIDAALLSKTRPDLQVRVLMLSILILSFFAPPFCVYGARKAYESWTPVISRGDSSPIFVISSGNSNPRMCDASAKKQDGPLEEV